METKDSGFESFVAGRVKNGGIAASSVFHSLGQSPLTPQKLGKYRILENLRQGSSGAVYRAWDETLGRTAYVRTIGQGIRWSPHDRSRFFDDYREIAALRHPNIASVYDFGDITASYDFGEEENTAYVAMEFLEGENLQNLLAAKTAFTLEDKLSLMVQAAEGLKYAHERGVLHRDIRPSKIFVESTGTVKVLDFGLTHLLLPHLARPPVRYGAPLYLSPEQIEGKECERSSDIFSLGVVLYELVACAHPFHDRDSNKALDNILCRAEFPLLEQIPNLPSGIRTILNTCLDREPAQRYPSAAELLDACREALQEVDEDLEFMQAELLMAFPRLKRVEAAGRESPPELRELLCGIRSIIECEEGADHATLSRLMNLLGAEYSEIRKASKTPRPVRLSLFSPPGTPERSAPVVSDSTRPVDAMARQEKPQPCEPPVSAPEQELQKGAPQNQKPAVSLDAREREAGEGTRYSQTGFKETVESSAAECTAPSGPAQAEMPAPSPCADDEEVPQISAARATPGARADLARVFRKIALYAIGICGGILALFLLIMVGYRIRDHFFTGVSSISSQSGSKEAPEPTSVPAPDNPATIDPTSAAKAQPQGANEGNVLRENLIQPAPDRQTGQIENLLALAAVMIQTGMLQEAKTMIDKAERIHPRLTETALLRKRLRAKQMEASGEARQNGKETKQPPAARSSIDEEAWNRQVEGLFKKGRYPEAQSMLDRWLLENPGSSRAREWKSTTEDAQQNLQKYALAIGERKYPEALDFLNRLERINPTDPHITELRQNVEGRNKAAKAHLTIYRLGEPASLRLDDVPLGKGGEAESIEVSAGRHTLTVTGEGAPPLVWHEDLSGEQQVFLVYDTAKPVLRAMSEGDLERRRSRKAAEQVYSLPVNHYHGLFRGSCAGELRLSAIAVEFVPNSGSHGFRVPFRDLTLKVHGKSIDLYNASDNKEFQSLRVEDDDTALKLKERWDKLEPFAR